MQSKALSVDDYLDEAPEERCSALRLVRALILQKLPNHKEQMKYGMAAYLRPGDTEPEVAFANQVQYISIYYPVAVVTASSHLLDGLNVGKCCVRYSTPKKLNLKIIEAMLDETIMQYGC